MANRTDGRSAGAAVVAADENHVGMGLGNASRDRAYANFGYQLHRDARARIRILQVVNELSQVLDRVNIVVRRR